MLQSSSRTLLSHNLRRYRAIHHLSQADLAEAVGCSATLITNIELMKRFPSPENLDRISAATGIPVSELFRDESPDMACLQELSLMRARLESGFKRLLDEALQVAPRD